MKKVLSVLTISSLALAIASAPAQAGLIYWAERTIGMPLALARVPDSCKRTIDDTLYVKVGCQYTARRGHMFEIAPSPCDDSLSLNGEVWRKAHRAEACQ